MKYKDVVALVGVVVTTVFLKVALGSIASASEPAAIAGPNQTLYEYLGEPVPAPTNMAVAYSKEGLTNALQSAAKAVGVSLKQLEVDDSEFPFLVGVSCGNGDDMEKLKQQIQSLPAYNYTGGVGGKESYAMNLVPGSEFSAGARDRIYRRVLLREQILSDRMHRAARMASAESRELMDARYFLSEMLKVMRESNPRVRYQRQLIEELENRQRQP